MSALERPDPQYGREKDELTGSAAPQLVAVPSGPSGLSGSAGSKKAEECCKLLQTGSEGSFICQTSQATTS
jgi:hypothetical protein